MAGELSGWEVLMLVALRAGHRHPDSQERMEEGQGIRGGEGGGGYTN